ncbi:MAG TPA: putative Ig domain-containing protein [Thermomonas sp.]|nr:putative Ig domain-containing protein [Thermomonas sp.]
MTRPVRAVWLRCVLALLMALPLAALAQDSGNSIPSPEGGSRVMSVSAGDFHSCGVKSDGSVDCWGWNDAGQAADQADPFISVSAGYYHSCGVKPDGSVVCWGDNDYGRAAAPSGAFVSVSAGYLHSCGVKSDGSVDCWGSNDYGQAAAPPGPFISVSASYYHSCGLKADGSVDCWGATTNNHGQAADQPGPFVSVSAGYLHSCGVKSDGGVDCWGSNDFGRAADQSGPFVSVSGGGYHSCGLKADGSVDCWGAGAETSGFPHYGQAADQSGPFVSVSAGQDHTCGVKADGSVHCWGAGVLGTSVHPNEGQSTAPADLGALGFGQIAAGNAHACQVNRDGSIACWGNNDEGQATSPAGQFAQVVAGDSHSCALGADGKVTCWGRNATGNQSFLNTVGRHRQLAADLQGHVCGLASTQYLSYPAGMPWCSPNIGFNEFPASRYITTGYGSYSIGLCAVNANGSGGCEGRPEPPGISNPPTGPWQRLESGLNHQCGLKADGSIECWGDNSEGQTTGVPTGQFRALSTGYNHACAIRDNGTLACWGSNLNGQATPPTGTFVQVSAGNTFTCAIRSNGTRVCWGSDTAGQAPQLALSPGLLPAGVVGNAYATTQFSVGDGDYVSPTPAFAVVAGALPAGLSLSGSGALTGTPTALGSFPFIVEAEDGNGFTASRAYSITILDNTPPVITYILSPASPNGANGWYTSSVGIDWAVSDPESAHTITNGCVDSTLNTDTAPAGTDYSCSASSAGGNAGPVTVTLKRDVTVPTIGITPSPAANAAGWNNADVSLQVACGDPTPGSGIASCPSIASVTTEGSTAIPAQQATDNAGNTSAPSSALTVKLDKTAPTLAPTVPSPLLRGGSYSASANGTDLLSGLASVSCNALDTSSTGSKSTTCSATDNAGNGRTVTLNYTVTTTCSNDGYKGTQLTWCQNICENGLTGAALNIWVHRWINRYRDLPYCMVGMPL